MFPSAAFSSTLAYHRLHDFHIIPSVVQWPLLQLPLQWLLYYCRRRNRERGPWWPFFFFLPWIFLYKRAAGMQRIGMACVTVCVLVVCARAARNWWQESNQMSGLNPVFLVLSFFFFLRLSSSSDFMPTPLFFRVYLSPPPCFFFSLSLLYLGVVRFFSALTGISPRLSRRQAQGQ